MERYAFEVGVVYYPGNTNYREFLQEYDSQLQKRKRAIVFGDFNVDLLDKNNKETKQYKAIVKEAGHVLLNKISKKYCTRNSITKKSIIDHISTNFKNDHFHMVILESSLSDHNQMYLELKKVKSPPRMRSQYEAMDYTQLYKHTESAEFNHNEDYLKWENVIKLCVKKSKTTKTKILNLPQKDWINKDIIAEINQRNVMWTELENNPNNEALKKQFSKKRDCVEKLIQRTKNTYYYDAITKSIKKPKKMWSVINYLANNKIKQSSAPSKLVVDSKITTKPNDICKIFNNYFATIGPLLAKEIPATFHDNYHRALPNYLPQESGELSSLKPCSAKEILQIITNLDPNCSTGIDGINTKAIKCIKNLIVNNLCTCFNKLLADGNFPDTLKIAKVTPIYKSGSLTDPGNYRPISVLPVMSKILEKVLHNRLQNYLNSINFITDRQYGFRPKSNTTTATIDLVTKIKQNIDNKNIVVGIFVDLKKAFDTVCHKLLLKKLESINITGSALKMFKSYLTNRSQIVKLGNHDQSNALPITCGVPQGSILGPLLFLIYINNITEINLHGHLTLYADDTCLFYFGSSIHDIITLAQDDLNSLYTWFQFNLLTINISKTCYVIFKAKNKIIPPFDPLKINDVPLQLKTSEKYLGLRIDSTLSWNAQIEYIKNKLSTLLGTLRNIVRCIPRILRYTIYNSLVKPHLLYLIELWGSATKTKLSELQRSQNKLIKMLFNYPFLTSTSKIYNDTKLMNIKQLYIYNTCIFINKVLNKKIHTNIILNQYRQVSQRSSRRASLIVLPKTRTNYGKKMVTFEGVQLYNKLPSSIRNVHSLNAFKIQLGQYLTARKTPSQK